MFRMWERVNVKSRREILYPNMEDKKIREDWSEKNKRREKSNSKRSQESKQHHDFYDGIYLQNAYSVHSTFDPVWRLIEGMKRTTRVVHFTYDCNCVPTMIYSSSIFDALIEAILAQSCSFHNETEIRIWQIDLQVKLKFASTTESDKSV